MSKACLPLICNGWVQDWQQRPLGSGVCPLLVGGAVSFGLYCHCRRAMPYGAVAALPPEGSLSEELREASEGPMEAAMGTPGLLACTSIHMPDTPAAFLDL
jgi:hypothetical protein